MVFLGVIELEYTVFKWVQVLQATYQNQFGGFYTPLQTFGMHGSASIYLALNEENHVLIFEAFKLERVLDKTCQLWYIVLP